MKIKMKKGRSNVDLMMMMMMVFFFMCCSSSSMRRAAAESSTEIQQKCSDEFTKVYSCLDYATGKGSAPSSSCCSSVAEILGKDPVCLCYIIQQTHNGSSATIKSLGIQFDRLLQLPQSCKLANASLTNCPKLLNLPANSPDNAIFTNAPKGSSSSPSTSSTDTASGTSNAATPSKAVMHRVRVDSIFMLAVICAIFLSIYL